MSSESRKYIQLWTKYRPVILNMMKSDHVESQYQLSQHDFESVGNRVSSGYSFLLRVNNNQVDNNIQGSAVARDLFEVLSQSPSFQDLTKINAYEIKLNSKWDLTVKKIV